MSNSPPTLDYNSQPTRSPLATASLTLGIIALPTSLIAIGILPGLAAIVCGVVAAHKIECEPHLFSGRVQAKIGIILGVLGVLASLIATVLLLMPNIRT